MHGGQILVRGRVRAHEQLGRELGEVEMTDAVWFELRRNLAEFAAEFGLDASEFHRDEFTRLAPVSHRPYGKISVY
jgi:glutamate synthase domain-containing protein 3